MGSSPVPQNDRGLAGCTMIARRGSNATMIDRKTQRPPTIFAFFSLGQSRRTGSPGNFGWPLVFVCLRNIASMKERILTGLVSAVLLASAVEGLRAGLTQHPYAAIISRNAFGLEAVTPPPPPPPPPAPMVDVFLTGISTVAGEKKVLLQLTDKTPGKKAEYLPPLRENEVQGRIEVVAIDADKGAVVVKIDGDKRTLTFEKDAPKPSATMPAVLPRGPFVHAGTTIHPPPPTSPAAVPSTPLDKFGVVVGGWNPAGTAGPSLPPTPLGHLAGMTNQRVSNLPSSPATIDVR
jgi:hypothetical protein